MRRKLGPARRITIAAVSNSQCWSNSRRSVSRAAGPAGLHVKHHLLINPHRPSAFIDDFFQFADGKRREGGVGIQNFPSGVTWRIPSKGSIGTQVLIGFPHDGSDDPLRGKESDLGATAKTQNRLVSLVQRDMMRIRETERPAIVVERRSFGKCRVNPTEPRNQLGFSVLIGGCREPPQRKESNNHQGARSCRDIG